LRSIPTFISVNQIASNVFGKFIRPMQHTSRSRWSAPELVATRVPADSSPVRGQSVIASVPDANAPHGIASAVDSYFRIR
jgi:hypothetical protein